MDTDKFMIYYSSMSGHDPRKGWHQITNPPFTRLEYTEVGIDMPGVFTEAFINWAGSTLEPPDETEWSHASLEVQFAKHKDGSFYLDYLCYKADRRRELKC